MSELKRVLRYGNKVFSLFDHLSKVSDCRKKEIIPTVDIVYSSYVMALTRMGSLNVLEELGESVFWNKYLTNGIPSVDEIAWASERISIKDIREVLYKIYKKARRNKIFNVVGDYHILIEDGHELFSSYARCCPDCLQRELEVNKTKRTQYYHRVVTAQIIGKDTHFIIDIELQKKGEDEVACATRLIERLLNRFPRLFNVVTLDALYARAPFINMLLKKNKEVVFVLKDNRRDLYKDAMGLFAKERPNKIFTSGKTAYLQWDIENFTSWDNLGHPLRVVRSLETTTTQKRKGDEWVETTVTKDWIWATTITQKKASTDTITCLGHKRWGIENEGYNHLRLWHFDHPYHHHPNSILFFLLITVIAFNIFHLMWSRNFKPEHRRRFSRKTFATLMLSEIAISCTIMYPP